MEKWRLKKIAGEQERWVEKSEGGEGREISRDHRNFVRESPGATLRRLTLRHTEYTLESLLHLPITMNIYILDNN